MSRPAVARAGVVPSVSESLRARSVAFLAATLSAVAGATEITHTIWLYRPHHQRIADAIFLFSLLLISCSFGLARRSRAAAWLTGTAAILSFSFHCQHGDTARLWGWELAVILVLVTFRDVFDLPRRWQLERADGEHLHAWNITSSFGSGAQDFFKLFGDKSLFFSRSGRSFLAYRVSHRMAVALGDPTGPPEERQETVREFFAHCAASGWRVALHQSAEALRERYASDGLRSICIGEDAIVDLTSFGLQGKGMKEFRNTVTRLDRLGCCVERIDPPVTADMVSELASISDEWLRLPGRRERRFTLGLFRPEYVAATAVYVARDSDGKALAFLNLPPTWSAGEAAIDLMRRREAGPNGIIDYLFTKTFLDLKNRGCTRVNLGMAPLCGLRVRADAGWDERLVYAVFRRLDHVFSFRGLRSFKAKYATRWEPRYEIYASPADLPRLGLAIRRITEIDDD